MIELVLDQCLEEIQGRRATPAQCLARYPQYADQLGPLLKLALAVQKMDDFRPSDEFKRSTRARLKQQPNPRPRRWFELLAARRA